MDPLLQRYQEMLSLSRTSLTDQVKKALVLYECQLAWLVYIVGAVTSTPSLGCVACWRCGSVLPCNSVAFDRSH